MTGQCSVMPMARLSGAASGEMPRTMKWTGHSMLIDITERRPTPAIGDFDFMKGEASGFCSKRPSGKIMPDMAAAVSAQSAGGR
jgi:hypothetical protein